MAIYASLSSFTDSVVYKITGDVVDAIYSFPGVPIIEIAMQDDSTFWAIKYVSNGNFQTLKIVNGVITETYTTPSISGIGLYIDKNNVVWVNTATGIYRIQNSVLTKVYNYAGDAYVGDIIYDPVSLTHVYGTGGGTNGKLVNLETWTTFPVNTQNTHICGTAYGDCFLAGGSNLYVYKSNGTIVAIPTANALFGVATVGNTCFASAGNGAVYRINNYAIDQTISTLGANAPSICSHKNSVIVNVGGSTQSVGNLAYVNLRGTGTIGIIYTESGTSMLLASIAGLSTTLNSWSSCSSTDEKDISLASGAFRSQILSGGY